MTTLTSEQFERTRRLASRLAGIELLERHREVLTRRSQRFGIHDEAGFDALLDAADAGDERASRDLIGLVTTNFTGFFRHPWHFRLAAEHALWTAHRRGRARLWSAAASTGEEPYSLAIALIEVFRRHDPPATIAATDIDETALATARRGEYAETALGGLEAEHRVRFSEDAGGGRRRIVQPARDLVEFHGLNLVDDAWPLAGPFDVVFCRNVLMYLDVGRRDAVVRRIAALMAPDGMLLLDPAEHLGGARDLFGPGAEGVYARRR